MIYPGDGPSIVRDYVLDGIGPQGTVVGFSLRDQ